MPFVNPEELTVLRDLQGSFAERRVLTNNSASQKKLFTIYMMAAAKSNPAGGSADLYSDVHLSARYHDGDEARVLTVAETGIILQCTVSQTPLPVDMQLLIIELGPLQSFYVTCAQDLTGGADTFLYDLIIAAFDVAVNLA